MNEGLEQKCDTCKQYLPPAERYVWRGKLYCGAHLPTFQHEEKYLVDKTDLVHRLEEATELLKEWKEFAYHAVPTGHVHFDFLGRKRMTEKTDRFLEKAGKSV